MATLAPGSTKSDTRWTAQKLTRWSLLLLPLYLLWALAVGFFGSLVVMPWLDLPEGSMLLMAGGVAGWAAEIGMTLLLIAPAVVGVVLAVKALRRGGGWAAWVPLVLFALVIAQTAISFVATVGQTYF